MNNLLRLIGRRLIALPIMAIGVTMLVFFIMAISPTDPAYSALGDNASNQHMVMQYRIYHGYYSEDGTPIPLIIRYLNYLGGLLQGNLGVYGVANQSVSDLIAPALPVTLQLTFFGLIIAVLISFPLGVLSALYRDRWPDQIIRVLSVISIGTPSFWLGAMLVLIGLQIFPGMVAGPLPPLTGPEADFPGWVTRMFLPALTLAVPVIGQMTRVVRTSVVEELERDYVRTALGAGIPKTITIARNVLRNALITPVTVLGLRVGYLMGGAVVIEIIFGIQGMGKVLVQGIQQNQVEVVQGAALVVALSFIIVNIIVDMLYLLINPRIRSV